MPKPAPTPSLNLNGRERDDQRSLSPGTLSPRSMASVQSPRSTSVSHAATGGSQMAQQPKSDTKEVGENGQSNSGRPSPKLTAMPEIPPSPGRASPKQHTRDASKSFFSNLMASKSAHKLHSQDGKEIESGNKQNGRSRTSSKDRSPHTVKRQTSTPDLPRLLSGGGQQVQDPPSEQPNQQMPPGSSDGTVTKQKSRSKLGGILTRSKSNRPEEDKKPKARVPAQLTLEVHPPKTAESETYAPPPKTAPAKSSHREQAFGTEHGSAIRNHSSDRAGTEDLAKDGQFNPTPAVGPHRDPPSLFANIQHTGRGVGDRLGKAGRGFFSKMTRSGSTTEREPISDENYVCTTINLPLVKQTRKTRIAKRLELSKDKTEFWMPALPWRCIDYLNMQCEQEGLYRVPGSGRDVKFWQRRFDIEHDINLFDEPELYDVNTIASLFKAWLRDLPDELFPKAIQSRIAHQCAGAQKTPQLLKDELSKLPPFNYYLLFAITCHLSLLHSYADQNKMDYRNLCICFQPCLKIDAFCFQFLVIDWKECWQQGCLTEKHYLEEEYRYEREGSVKEREEIPDERAVSSSGSSAHVANQALPQTAEGHSKAPTAVPLRPKQRSLSSSNGTKPRVTSHGHTNTAPTVPRMVSHTPENKAVTDESLPELGNLSPIRM